MANQSNLVERLCFLSSNQNNHYIAASLEHKMASHTNYEQVSGGLESFLEAVDSILQQCAVHEGIQDTGFVLHLVNSLQNAITVLQCILNNERISSNSSFVYLLFLICSILQQWEHKLFNFESASANCRSPYT